MTIEAFTKQRPECKADYDGSLSLIEPSELDQAQARFEEVFIGCADELVRIFTDEHAEPEPDLY